MSRVNGKMAQRITANDLRIANQEFNESLPLKKIFRQANLIKQCDLTMRSFKNMEKNLREATRILPIIIDDGIRTANISKIGRVLSGQIVYMGADEGQNKLFRPNIFYLYMNKQAFTCGIRPIPIGISDVHLSEQYESRIDFTNDFTYHDEYSQFIMAYSIVASKAMEEYLVSNDKNSALVAIPHPEGLYYGRGYLLENNYHLNLTKSFELRRVNRSVYANEKLNEAWTPNVDIELRTIYSTLEMDRNSAQLDLHNRLVDKYWNNKEYRRALNLNLLDYTMGSNGNSFQEDTVGILNEIHQSMLDDMNSDEWKIEARYSDENEFRQQKNRKPGIGQKAFSP